MNDAAVPRVAVRTLGCKVNQAESEQLLEELLEAGCEPSEDPDASVVVVNSCCVTAEAARKVLKTVRRALRSPSAPTVVVTGCLSRVDPGCLSALGRRVVVQPDGARVTADVLAGAGNVRAAQAGGGRARRPDLFRTRVMVKVQDGCDGGCAYCIVPAARGASRSERMADVVGAVGSAVSNGSVEVVLTGVNLGRFRDGSADLADLVRAAGATGVRRLRLSSIEPQHVDGRLARALAETPAVCPHLHVPLQSGSDAVLARMGRAYDAAAFRAAVSLAGRAVPVLTVTTDVMVGFPGETEADVERTLALLESLDVPVSRVHVFRFSPRPGTAAAAMDRQVPAAVARERAALVRGAGEGLRERYVRSRLGGRAEVLVETTGGGTALGTSRDYLKIRVPGSEASCGDLLDVVVDGMHGECVAGTIHLSARSEASEGRGPGPVAGPVEAHGSEASSHT